jgi:hydrogenase expression/formation protein HypD
MRYLDEYRDGRLAQRLLDRLAAEITRPWTVMEVCGGQTHTLVRQGIDQLLPEELRLVHGPGCPVCVTPLSLVDHAIEIARRPEVILCSFGDMLRVPGSGDDLLRVRAAGGDVRVVYSPLDALRVARENPQREVVFFAVGFETTAPGNAMAVRQAALEDLANFSVLVAHVMVPPAMHAVLTAPGNQVQGFLGPGHVCTVMGWADYEVVASRFRTPIVICGFEPVDLLEGLLMLVQQLEAGRCEVENQYGRSVRQEGNRVAQAVVTEVFEPCDRVWRGIGVLSRSGLQLRGPYRRFDGALRFPQRAPAPDEPEACLAGLVLQGRVRPDECPAFGVACTPDHPLGAPMVSSEGACAAYHAAGRAPVAAPSVRS